MSLSSGQILNFLLSFIAEPSVISPLSQVLNASVPCSFQEVSGLQIFSGTFTPANNEYSIASFASAAAAPNFVFLLVDGQTNMTFTTASANVLDYYPIGKLFFVNSPIFSSDYITSIYFDGRTAVQNPMAQGVPIDYTIIFGQATIS